MSHNTNQVKTVEINASSMHGGSSEKHKSKHKNKKIQYMLKKVR